MKTLDTTFQRPDYGGAITPSSKKQKKKDCNPSLTLEGQAAQTLIQSLDDAQEFTATVKLKVTRKMMKTGGDDDWGPDGGCEIAFDVLSITPEKVKMMESEDEEETAEDAIRKYKKGD